MWEWIGRKRSEAASETARHTGPAVDAVLRFILCVRCNAMQMMLFSNSWGLLGIMLGFVLRDTSVIWGEFGFALVAISQNNIGLRQLAWSSSRLFVCLWTDQIKISSLSLTSWRYWSRDRQTLRIYWACGGSRPQLWIWSPEDKLHF